MRAVALAQGERLRKPRVRTADLKEAKVLLKKLTNGGRNDDPAYS